MAAKKAITRSGYSRRLTTEEQTAVAQYSIDHPDMSDAELGRVFQVTSSQVRTAREKGELGELKVRRQGPGTEGRTRSIMHDRDPSEIMEEQLHYAVAQIAADPDMPARERIALLGTAARMERTLQSTRLIAHMKELDAELLKRIIRRFNPDASEERCTTIYLEEVALWQAELDSH